jgi:F-type H+-transporting ATPase subunit epsilon
MNSFALELLDSRGRHDFNNVIQFIAADASGSFGVLAGHAHLVAVLRYGLARFLDSQGDWYYLTLPGGVLRFCNNRLTVTTVRYFLGSERDLLCQQLADEMAQNDSEVHAAQATLSEIEHSLIRRLAELSKLGGGVL